MTFRNRGALAHRFAILLALVITATVSARPAAAQTDAAKTEARAHLAEARKLFEAGDHAGSLRKLEAAYALVPSPKILFSFGQTYRGLGREPDALEAFERFLAEAADADPALRAEARQYVDDLSRRLARIDVTADTEGAGILIDGRARGVTPLARAIIVSPGAHDVEVRREGIGKHTERVNVRAGQIARVQAHLAPRVTAAPLAPWPSAGTPASTAVDLRARTATEPEPLHKRPWFWPAAGGAAVLVGIIVVVAATAGGTEVPNTTLGAQRVFTGK